MAMNAVDFYTENGKIIKHQWAMGGESHEEVQAVPTYVDGYKKIAL